MDLSNNLVPHILCVMSSAPEQQQSVDKIVRFVENRLKGEGKQINDIEHEIHKAIHLVNDLGLISTNNNTVRLKYNPNSKPPSGFQSINDEVERKRSVQTEDWGEGSNDGDGQNDTNTAEDTETSDQIKPSRSSSVKTSLCTIYGPLQSRMRSRKRKSQGRIGRSRSRSSKRRRH